MNEYRFYNDDGEERFVSAPSMAQALELAFGDESGLTATDYASSWDTFPAGWFVEELS